MGLCFLRHDHAPAVHGIYIAPTAKQLAKMEAKRCRSTRTRLRRAKAAAAERASVDKFWLFMAALSALIAIDWIGQGCTRDYSIWRYALRIEVSDQPLRTSLAAFCDWKNAHERRIVAFCSRTPV